MVTRATPQPRHVHRSVQPRVLLSHHDIQLPELGERSPLILGGVGGAVFLRQGRRGREGRRWQLWWQARRRRWRQWLYTQLGARPDHHFEQAPADGAVDREQEVARLRDPAPPARPEGVVLAFHVRLTPSFALGLVSHPIRKVRWVKAAVDGGRSVLLPY